MSPAATLERLRAALATFPKNVLNPSLLPRLNVVEAAGLLHVDFCGQPDDAPYDDLCRTLAGADVAGTLASIVLRSPDVGANGLCNFDLGELLAGGTPFASLRTFEIQQRAPGDHNGKVVGPGYHEEGQLARLLAKSPVLDALISPSAPDASFFEVDAPCLRALSVDSGLATQDFVRNLARSTRLTGLRNLEFGEFRETCIDTFLDECTPFEDYDALFRSPVFASMRSFTWRNPVCSPEQIAALRALRPTGLQFTVIRFSSEYVRNPG